MQPSKDGQRRRIRFGRRPAAMACCAARRATRRACAILALVVPVLVVAVPGGPASAADPEGAGDHPLIPRYDGATIVGYDYRAFEQFTLPLGPQVRDSGNNVVLADSIVVEGRHTRIIYAAPANRSTLEVFENYRKALAETGFESLFSCTGDDCGERALLATKILYAPDRRLRTLGPVTEFAFSFPLQPYYMAAQLPRGDGDIFVSLYVARENFDAFPETQNRALILLDVIEPGQLEDRIGPDRDTPAESLSDGQVAVVPAGGAVASDAGIAIASTAVPSMATMDMPVAAPLGAHDAASIEAALRSRGRVAIYAIEFASGSAKLTEESYDVIDEIVRVLDRNPDLKLFVVGHSDNQGSYQVNMTLSQRRAEAVVRALVERGSIARDRLRPASVGMLVPVASNETEEGRALNRRVELVVQ